jgi:5-methylthioadenosine/S-adenosylhomocysteine deaminase
MYGETSKDKGDSVPPGRIGEGDLVIEGGIILTMTESHPVLENSNLEVAGGKIKAIRRNDAVRVTPPLGVERIDATGCIVMPGLINCHTHAAMTLFRGLADDLPLKTWLFERIFPAEAAILSPETVYTGTMLACIEMLSSGTTCFMDGYFFEDSALKAAHEAGIRAVLAQGVIDLPAPGVPDSALNLRVASSFLGRWKDFSSLLTPAVFCHSPLTCSEKTLIEASAICMDYGVPLFIHLSETRWEVEEVERETGKTPVHFLDSIGLLNDNLVAVHCTHVSNEEIRAMAANGVKAIHVPSSNMKLGCGLAPVAAMIKAGIRPGLGTDGCASSNNLDMFREMDIAAKASKIQTGNPTALIAMSALKAATVWAAQAAGLGEVVGTIEEGKRADLIIIDCKKSHLHPLYDPVSSLVYSADGSDVRDVIVDGKVMIKDGTFRYLSPDDIMEETRRLSLFYGKGLPPKARAGN